MWKIVFMLLSFYLFSGDYYVMFLIWWFLVYGVIVFFGYVIIVIFKLFKSVFFC